MERINAVLFLEEQHAKENDKAKQFEEQLLANAREMAVIVPLKIREENEDLVKREMEARHISTICLHAKDLVGLLGRTVILNENIQKRLLSWLSQAGHDRNIYSASQAAVDLMLLIKALS